MSRKIKFRKIRAASAVMIMTFSILRVEAAEFEAALYPQKAPDIVTAGKETTVPERYYNMNGKKELLRNFMAKNLELYLEQGLNPDFPYFNIEKYMASNPDLAAVFAGNQRQILIYYITIGCVEGESSQTSFDPAAAIVSYPKIVRDGNLDVDAVMQKYKAAAGGSSTERIVTGGTPADIPFPEISASMARKRLDLFFLRLQARMIWLMNVFY